MTYQQHDPRESSDQHDQNSKNNQSPGCYSFKIAKFVPGDDSSDVQEDGLLSAQSPIFNVRSMKAGASNVNARQGKTYRVEKLINYVLKRVIFRLLPEPVVPCETVANDETTQYVI